MGKFNAGMNLARASELGRRSWTYTRLHQILRDLNLGLNPGEPSHSSALQCLY